MRRKNTSNTNASKLPNGQNKIAYRRKCNDFIETYYADLRKYALHHTRGEEDKADDLLQHTILVMMEGGDSIDFDRAPRKYFDFMLRREQERKGRVKQRKFEKDLVLVDNFCTEGENKDSPLLSRAAFDEWQRQEREDLSFRDILDQFPAILDTLTDVERTHIGWYLDGLSRKEMKKFHPVSDKRLDQILGRVRKKIKKQVELIRSQVVE